MAQASALLSYNVTTDREDLTDIIAMISPEETPMYSKFRKVKASNTYHEWSTDSLSAAAANAQIEGADFSFSKPTAPSRVGGYTQIFTKTVEVAGSQKAQNVAGMKDMFAYQVEKKLKEIKRDFEYALINGTGNSGASGTGRAIKGVLSALTTNVETGSATGTEALTEAMYNDMLQTIFASGGSPNTSYANSWQKRKISAFSTSNTRYIETADKKLINTVAIYESDFGLQEIVLDRYMTTTVVACLQDDQFAIANYRPVMVEEVAKVGDADRKAIVAEWALEYGAEAASGQITGLTTS